MEIDQDISIKSLPIELLISIFHFLSLKAICNSRSVCKLWCEIIDDNGKITSLIMTRIIEIVKNKFSTIKYPTDDFLPPLPLIPLISIKDENKLIELTFNLDKQIEVINTKKQFHKIFKLCQKHNHPILRGIKKIYIFFRNITNKTFESGFHMTFQNIVGDWEVHTYSVTYDRVCHCNAGIWSKQNQTPYFKFLAIEVKENWKQLVQTGVGLRRLRHFNSMRLWHSSDNDLSSWNNMPQGLNRVFDRSFLLEDTDAAELLSFEKSLSKEEFIAKCYEISTLAKKSTLAFKNRILVFFRKIPCLYGLSQIIKNENTIIKDNVGCLYIFNSKNEWQVESFILSKENNVIAYDSKFKTNDINKWDKITWESFYLLKMNSSLINFNAPNNDINTRPKKRRKRVTTDLELRQELLKTLISKSEIIKTMDFRSLQQETITQETFDSISKTYKSSILKFKQTFIVIYKHHINTLTISYFQFGALLLERRNDKWYGSCLQTHLRGQSNFSSFVGFVQTVDQWKEAQLNWLLELVKGNRCLPFTKSPVPPSITEEYYELSKPMFEIS